ncbi:hypothetical protein K474DRAFT_1634525 [Panus rudis PR-1116 ss-1]|nr:hypothetical protein K474DRAFT_1634525 [Panus rudis PR-1116 ss-1]
MSSQVSFTFPSPIGGVPYRSDYTPSFVFAVLYGLLIPITIYRFACKSSRTMVVAGTVFNAVERIVVLALRAEQATSRLERTDSNLTSYLQTSYIIGYLAIAADLVILLRSLLVQATAIPQERIIVIDDPESGDKVSLMEKTDKVDVRVETKTVSDRRQRERLWYRRITVLALLECLAPFVVGIVAGIVYTNGTTNKGQADLTRVLLYVGAGLSALALLTIQLLAVYAALFVRNAIRSSALLLVGITALLEIITIYHLITLNQQSRGSSSSTSDALAHVPRLSLGSDTFFYVFQIIPEYIASVILVGINARERFQTGMWGDSWFRNYVPVRRA